MKSVVLEPIITEKTSQMLTEGKYVFYTAPDANKIEVRKFIEDKYGVNVTKVNIGKKRSKVRRRGRILGATVERKTATVSLKSGEVIQAIQEMF